VFTVNHHRITLIYPDHHPINGQDHNDSPLLSLIHLNITMSDLNSLNRGMIQDDPHLDSLSLNRFIRGISNIGPRL
jgi:hypothetical protein